MTTVGEPLNTNETKSFEQGPEHIYLRRSILNELPLLILLLAAAFFGLFLTRMYPESVQYIELWSTNNEALNLPIPLFALPPLLLFFTLWHRLYDAKYLIAADHVRSVSGLLSLKVKDLRIDFESIRGIEVERSIYQRLLNIGDLQVGSAMHADVEINMVGILHPGKYREILEDRIRGNFTKLYGQAVKKAVAKEER